MQHNVGAADRAVRIILGLVVLSATVFVRGDARWWGLIGVIPLLTGIAASCPLYSLFSLSTCPRAQPKM
jgi:Protein of unknown function (DUF2892)